MNCRNAEQDIALYVEGDLPPARLQRIEDHLAGCARCRLVAEDLRESQAALKDLREETVTPAALVELRSRVLAEITAMKHAGASLRRSGWWRFQIHAEMKRLVPYWRHAFAGTASVLMAGMAVWYMAHRPQPLPVPLRPPLVGLNVPEQPASQGTGSAPVTEAAKAPARMAAANPRPSQPGRSPRAPLVTEAPDERPAVEPQQIVMKLFTDDPDIVIYWLLDSQGGKL
jgi:hypothetical protein